MKICICGGGNLGHVISGYLAAKGCEINLLSRQPEKFKTATRDGSGLVINDIANNRKLKGNLNVVTDSPSEALRGVSLIILCLPGFAIPDVLKEIAPHITADMNVGSVFCSSGFFPMAMKIMPKETKLFGLQRVPFIARIVEYGKEANLMGYRDHLYLATENCSDIERDELKISLAALFDEPVSLLDSYLEVTLTNSNPLLHPSRLYAMFGEKEEYDHNILFYEEWDNKSSEVLIACDEEFQKLREKLGIPQSAIPTSLEHYESHDAASMTSKITSIESLKGIKTPMLETGRGTFIPDYNSRYFTEDIPYGLLLIKSYAIVNGIYTPTIDNIIYWAQDKMGKIFLVNGRLVGKDIDETVASYVIS